MSTLRSKLLLATSTALAIALTTSGAFAQANGIGNSQGLSPAAAAFWTPERMANAIPYPTPRKNISAPTSVGPSVARRSQSAEGFVPKTEPVAARMRPLNLPAPKAAQDSVGTQSKGSKGYPFTTQLVSPDNVVNTWPHRLAGKLFFTDNGVGYVCSASILRPRMVVTAAHCVYNTSANRWHANFRFVPAYNGNSATQPYGTWNWAYAWVPTGWINGSESFPNAYDFAFLEMGDQYIAGATRKIGSYLGYFGWQTYAAIGNHVTQLGYPGNLESGRRMIRNDAEARSAGGGIAAEIGSAMWKGSSGGPWLQDFGVQASNQYVTSTGPNRIVAVTSYGSTAQPTPGPQYLGATVFNSTFANILNNQACPRRAGNC